MPSNDNTAQKDDSKPVIKYPGLDGKSPWTLEATEIVDMLDSDAEIGLDQIKANKRFRHYGPNQIKTKKHRSTWKILTAQFKNLIALLLVAAALVSFTFGQMLEGISIIVAMLVNVVIGFWTELRAVRSMEALQEMTRVQTKILRGEKIHKIPAKKLVPGDIVVLESGDMIPADLRLLEANRMQADESPLTGESVPVEKAIDVLSEDMPLAERNNMLFKGTALTHGSGKGVVVSTGMSTELGHISEMAQEAEEEALTPLEQRLNSLGQKLIWITLGIAGLVGFTGYIAGENLFLILKTSIALAVAAIPEGLPIVATIALARGMWRMAGKNALVNRLSSVETLGATSVICTDKTGTLTENKMTVNKVCLPTPDDIVQIDFDPDSDPPFNEKASKSKDRSIRHLIVEILTVGVLCNNAQLSENGEAVGDPTEVALLQAGLSVGIKRDSLLKEQPEKKEVAFRTETKMMATWHRQDQMYVAAIKGAPEAVLKASTRILSEELKELDLDDALRDKIIEINQNLAGKGLRMMAMARKQSDTIQDDPYSSLTFLGLVGLLDPPRKGVKEVIAELNKAGIRVVMVTGDQHKTAEYIGNVLGLGGKDELVIQGQDLGSTDDLNSEKHRNILNSSIFARITPEQKLNLVKLFQADGSVVAMTGDGVNDAPALTKADIGIAMGRRGTQVAKEASDIVLKDDAFSTIALAVEQGRVIFNNIRKFIVFLLSGNVGAILIVGIAMLFGNTLPLLPLQILYLNMISDVFPALALGVGKGDRSVMENPPRPSSEPVIPNALWAIIAGYGILIALAVLTSFWIALDKMALSGERAVTISFLTLAFARTWHVFNMRDFGSNPLFNDITRNPFVWGSVFLSIGLLLIAVYLQPLAMVLDMVLPTTLEWGLILGMSLTPLVVVQILKQFLALDFLRRKGSFAAKQAELRD
jgi:P-type Ca2+ transporter type 2C